MQKIKGDWNEIIRMIFSVFVLTSYVLLLPVSIYFALLSPMVLINSNPIYLIMYFSLLSIPILIIITFIASFKTKGKSLRWLLLPLIGIFVLVLASAGDHYYRERKQFEKQPIPFSQRGLPPPATDIPVTLPPDPGEAGKKTLAGIDSNNDGVRDDLEREIVYMYPQNEEVRRVLRAIMKKQQDMIITTGDHDHFAALAVSETALWDCYNYLLFGNGARDYSRFDSLMTLVWNTPERFKNYKRNSNIALPYATEVGSATACEKVKGQY